VLAEVPISAVEQHLERLEPVDTPIAETYRAVTSRR
jgi:hypothetical protein